jgi:hypothetical protein
MNRLMFLLIFFFLTSCSAGLLTGPGEEVDEETIIYTNTDGKGEVITLSLQKGISYYYPLMAVWLENEKGDYIQTLYVPASVATGVFRYGEQKEGKWVPAPRRAPQTLPYWSHKRGVVYDDGLYMPDPDNPIPDAYSGATPTNSFTLNTRADATLDFPVRVLLEINQNWDWNDYWTNNKYPDDNYYKMSCQPALVYEAVIDKCGDSNYLMQLTGHSHYSGSNGELYSDVSTFTTALEIIDTLVVRIRCSGE